MLANCMKFAELERLFEKNKPKMLISGRLAGVPAGSSTLPTPNFRPIRRDLSPNLAVEDSNGWRCSEASVHGGMEAVACLDSFQFVSAKQ
jgi:hypothetical protein